MDTIKLVTADLKVFIELTDTEKVLQINICIIFIIRKQSPMIKRTSLIIGLCFLLINICTTSNVQKQPFSCEFCEISKNIFSIGHLWWLLLNVLSWKVIYMLYTSEQLSVYGMVRLKYFLCI